MGGSPGAQHPRDLSDCSSIDLLDLVRTGDRDALEILFERYLKPLRKWASGRLPRWARDLADTQDLVQDVLLQTFKRIDLFEPERSGALEAYLRQGVMNRIREELRRKARRPAAAMINESLPSVEPSPLEEAMGAELSARYERALSRMRPEERDVIVGRIELDLSYEELAQALGRPTANAARSAVVRAMIRLAEEMAHE
ncbi:MAG TPA: sigma-70 family RNA polymerase sigma factor [Vicinamibacterales bacterium]